MYIEMYIIFHYYYHHYFYSVTLGRPGAILNMFRNKSILKKLTASLQSCVL